MTKPKDPKRVATGRAGAAARKAKQERLLGQLRAAKESFIRDTNGDGTSDVAPQRSKVSVVAPQQQRQEHTDRLHGNLRDGAEGQTAWTPWIIRACITGGVIVVALQQVAQNTRLPLSLVLLQSNNRNPASMAAGPVPDVATQQAPSSQRQPKQYGVQDKSPDVKQLEASPDPFYMK